MTMYTNPNSAIGSNWGIASVNKSVTDDNNKMLFFKYIINDDTTVVYEGTFYFSKTIYTDRYSNSTNNAEQNTYISLTDLKNVIRDYPTVTMLQLSRLFQRLLNTCLDLTLSNVTDLTGYVLCANIDGSVPTHYTVPDVTGLISFN